VKRQQLRSTVVILELICEIALTLEVGDSGVESGNWELGIEDRESVIGDSGLGYGMGVDGVIVC
jgi:hypothetical protein